MLVLPSVLTSTSACGSYKCFGAHYYPYCLTSYALLAELPLLAQGCCRRLVGSYRAGFPPAGYAALCWAHCQVFIGNPLFFLRASYVSLYLVNAAPDQHRWKLRLSTRNRWLFSYDDVLLVRLLSASGPRAGWQGK